MNQSCTGIWFYFLGLLPCVNGLWASVEKTVLVHYMPWFSTKTENQEWGWHWTMNHRDPDLEMGWYARDRFS